MINKDNEPTKEKKWFLSSESAIIAIAPAVAYLLAFIYELGYCTMLGIPSSFIQVSLLTILNFTVFIIFIFIIMTIIIDVALSFFVSNKNSHTAIYKVLVARFPIIFIGLLFLIVYGFDYTGWKVIGVTLLLVFTSDILPALVPKKYMKHLSFSERIDNLLSGARIKEDNTHTIYDVVYKSFGRRGVLIMLFIVWSVILTFYMGRAEATKKEVFLSPSYRQELFVGRIYGDKAICFTIDNVSRHVNPGISIINLSNTQNIDFKSTKTGKLIFNN